jgi:hypothetical protein
MGLDWCLRLKPKNGYEAELQQILKRLNEEITDEEYDQLIKRRDEISIIPCQAVNAPKLKDRDGWKQQMTEEFNENHKQASAKKLEEYLQEQAEKYDCAHCPAQALVTGMLVRGCEFRGKVIAFIDGLPSELKQRAYKDMNANEMLHYASQLEAYLDNVSEEDREYLQGAIDFLKRWGNLDFSISAWY